MPHHSLTGLKQDTFDQISITSNSPHKIYIYLFVNIARKPPKYHDYENVTEIKNAETFAQALSAKAV